jgi:hypothetical protein
VKRFDHQTYSTVRACSDKIPISGSLARSDQASIELCVPIWRNNAWGDIKIPEYSGATTDSDTKNLQGIHYCTIANRVEATNTGESRR